MWWWWTAARGGARRGGWGVGEAARTIVVIVGRGRGSARGEAEGVEGYRVVCGGWRASLGEPQDFGGNGGAGFESVRDAVADVAGAADA